MNNFFLLHEALNLSTLDGIANGIIKLNEAVVKKSDTIDVLLRHEDFWHFQTAHGHYYELPGKLNGELNGLSVKLFNSFSPIENYIRDEEIFDSVYPNDCNGFAGFDFSTTTIPDDRCVIDSTSFNTFKTNCAQRTAYNSIQDFWNNRTILFPDLVFCEEVQGQITHLSVNDDRFKLINDKLKKLNAYTEEWKTGQFDYNRTGLDCSPDTPTRIEATKTLRTFKCQGLGDIVFSLHAKWSFGREPFRLYFHPEPSNHKVHIAYIGNKSDIGFS